MQSVETGCGGVKCSSPGVNPDPSEARAFASGLERLTKWLPDGRRAYLALPPRAARCVGHRVDRLVVGFVVAMDRPTVSEVHGLLDRAERLGCAAVELGAVRGSGTKRGDRLVVRCDGFFVVINPRDPWSVVVELGASACMLLGAGGCGRLARSLARSLGEVEAERVRRVDLAADFVGFDLQDLRGADWRLRNGTASTWDYALLPRSIVRRRYRKRQTITGWTVCPGNVVMLRVYDKQAELHAAKVDTAWERASLEIQAWRRSGWRGGIVESSDGSWHVEGEAVSRVEFQVRSEGLDTFRLGAKTFRDLDLLLSNIGALWRYLTWRWCALAKPRLNGHGSARVDERWLAVRAVRWDDHPAEVVRERRRGGASAAQAYGCALSAAARTDRVVVPPADVDAWVARVGLAGVLDAIVRPNLLAAAEVFAAECADEPGARAALGARLAERALCAAARFGGRVQSHEETDASAVLVGAGGAAALSGGVCGVPDASVRGCASGASSGDDAGGVSGSGGGCGPP